MLATSRNSRPDAAMAHQSFGCRSPRWKTSRRNRCTPPGPPPQSRLRRSTNFRWCPGCPVCPPGLRLLLALLAQPFWPRSRWGPASPSDRRNSAAWMNSSNSDAPRLVLFPAFECLFLAGRSACALVPIRVRAFSPAHAASRSLQALPHAPVCGPFVPNIYCDKCLGYCRAPLDHKSAAEG